MNKLTYLIKQSFQLLIMLGILAMSQCDCAHAGKKVPYKCISGYENDGICIYASSVLLGVNTVSIMLSDRNCEDQSRDLLKSKLVIYVIEEKDANGHAIENMTISHDNSQFDSHSRSITIPLDAFKKYEPQTKGLSLSIPLTFSLLHTTSTASARLIYRIIGEDGIEILQQASEWKSVKVGILMDDKIAIQELSKFNLQVDIANLSPHVIDLKLLSYTCQIGNNPVILSLAFDHPTIDSYKSSIMLSPSEIFPLLIERWLVVPELNQLKSFAKLPVTFIVQTQDKQVLASKTSLLDVKEIR